MKGALTSFADLGNPVTGATSFSICVYDEIAGNAELKLGAVTPAGGVCGGTRPCWRQMGSSADPRGFRYVDRELTPEGVRSLTIRQGVEGRAGISLSARGVNLVMPVPASPTKLLDQDTRVTVQLIRNDVGLCWQSIHTPPPSENSGTRFSARN